MSLFQGLFSAGGAKSSLFDTKSAFFASSAATAGEAIEETKINTKKRKERDAPVAADEPKSKKSSSKHSLKPTDERATKSSENADEIEQPKKEKKSKESMQAQISKVAKAIKKTKQFEKKDDAAPEEGPEFVPEAEQEEDAELAAAAAEIDAAAASDNVESKKPQLTAAEQAEKLKRTIFVGNVKVTKSTKSLLKKLFTTSGKVESVRLRSLAFQAEAKGDRRSKALQGKVDEARAVAHAYVVFEEAASVGPALSLNNSLFQGLHIRVDRASAPSKKISAAKKAVATASDPADSSPYLDPLVGPQHYDPARSLFVGNLPFHSKDEDLIALFSDKAVAPELSGAVEAVRVVRDPATQIGKGFAFVLFRTKAAVRVALYRSEGWTMNKRALRLDRVTPSSPMAIKQKPKPAAAEGGGGAAKQPLTAFAASFSKLKSRFASKSSVKKNAAASDGGKNEEWQGVKTKGKSKGTRGPKEAPKQAPSSAAGDKGSKVEKKSVKRPSVANRKLKEKGLPLKAVPKPIKGSSSKGRRGGHMKKR